MFSKLTQLSAFVAGSGSTLSDGKVALIAKGIFFLSLFILGFIIWYQKYTRDDVSARKLLWQTGIILGLVFLGKFLLFHFFKGYVPDRLLFYGIPSPKAQNILWFILPIIFFAAFMYFWKKIMTLPSRKFLLTLWLFFVIISLSIAGTRIGTYSIYEHFSRTGWEYTGDLDMIRDFGGVHSFLQKFTALHNAPIMSHTVTHPPGFTLLLYVFQQLFRVDFLGLSIMTVMFGALSIIPLYYFLKEFADESTVRRGLMLYIFFPGTLLMGATSMDFTFVTVVWASIYLLYKGWQKNMWLAFLGGIIAAAGIMMNFLILLLAPYFVYLIYRIFTKGIPVQLIVGRCLASIATCFVSLWLIYYGTGYSIIENFWLARHIQSQVVESNFLSLWQYGTFAIMNILAFLMSLGISSLLILGQKLTWLWREHRSSLVAFVMMIFFVVIGIFQGEVERIWLFITPLFIIPIALSLKDFSDKRMTSMTALLFFQSFAMQILFYTYW